MKQVSLIFATSFSRFATKKCLSQNPSKSNHPELFWIYLFFNAELRSSKNIRNLSLTKVKGFIF